ncbi:ABC transporter substrate-binding protein [Streptomyces aidingensis]|uniref:Iron complex transport system substrate-binding protein n=1 Tax=Streptomyces aidingensis TaxID=910347 RepID=A0A1I1UB00_9ACTN|nr:ABC transporter substrate-binding protein [Streptomyces aidingensis]SFD67917.1 iron complex transport system substrate-binding protein [Streptomyces aidingensis]
MTISRAKLTRRSLLATGGALGAGALLTACGSDSGSAEAGGDNGGGNGGNGSGPWSFTDDRGTTVELDRTPEKIVAFTGTAAALYDYGVECVGVFGPTVTADGEPDVQAGELNVDKLTVLGNAWGEFNVEKYAGLAPELLVTNMFVENGLWYVPDESAETIAGLAPTVGIAVAPAALPSTTLLSAIERTAELAGALGADLTARQNTEARTRFEAAAESLRQAARDSGGLTVLACSGDPDLFYASDPSASADLAYFKELGVQIVTPDNVEGGFFESLSWENADKYRTDLVMLDNRSSALQPADLADKPTWTRLPAVEAGQVIEWTTEPRYSYAGCAPLLEALAEALRTAKRVS